MKFGSVYVFTLRRVSNNALLEALTVTVFDILEERVKMAVAAIELRNRVDPPQLIYGLLAVPGVDTVDVSFRTRRPTIPRVEVLDERRTVLASWFPLFGGLRTAHRGVLGLSTPLPQGTELRLRITAAGRADIFGRQRDSVLEARFTTGTRSVEVLFETITVHNDGDPGIKASGELTFWFTAADFASSEDSQAPSYEGNISSGDPPRFANRSILLPVGPRNVYVKVYGRESDIDIPAPLEGIGAVGRYGDRSLGSGGSESSMFTRAWVARRFDVSAHPPGFKAEPFTMRTAPLGISFTVNGLIITNVRAGRGAFTLPFKPFQADDGKVLGRAAAYGVTGATGGRSIVGRVDDGSLWLKRIDEDKAVPRTEGWERLAPDPGGAATAIQLDQERLEVVALGRQGEPLRLRDGRWVEIGGGPLTGALEVARDGHGGAHIAGLDGEGRVLLGTLEGDWRTVGDGVLGELQALAIGTGGLALLAIDREGLVLHTGSRDGREIGWLQLLNGPRAVLLGACELDTGGLAVCLQDEDGDLHVLNWPDWPERPGQQRWERLGKHGELDAPKPLTVPCPRRPIDEGDPCSVPAPPGGPPEVASECLLVESG